MAYAPSNLMMIQLVVVGGYLQKSSKKEMSSVPVAG